MLQEPQSLFIYNDSSTAARSVRQAIYDGPFDLIDFQLQPVILDLLPSVANGDLVIDTVMVSSGESIVDAGGTMAKLEPGVQYYPTGCNHQTCVQTYEGSEDLELERMTVRYRLRAGLLWSDGSPLLAGDSQYAYEVARSLYPRFRAELIQRTLSYRAIDELTVEWVGIPGYLDARYAAFFFAPMPETAWSVYAPEDLLTAEVVNRTPMGWGAYIVQEWSPGDHISLVKNPNYWRAAEGLPAFDRLVFRFLPNREEALAALLAGECDLIDETGGLEYRDTDLGALEEQGEIAVSFDAGGAWEHADFGILPSNPEKVSLFSDPNVRRAVASCIDRQRLANDLYREPTRLMHTFIPEEHPLYNPNAHQYTYDPQAAGEILDAAGWRDLDADPETARTSLGVSGIPDGTPLSFQFITIQSGEKENTAEIMAQSMDACGIAMEIVYTDVEQLFAPGPEGVIFGRNFDLAQFAWAMTLEPACELYTSAEIPGPYPEFIKGWGGTNPSGYSNPEFDNACQLALRTLPDGPEHAEAHALAQSIFAQDLPVIPLYQRLRLIAARPDICNLAPNPSSSSALWNLESLNYGEACSN